MLLSFCRFVSHSMAVLRFLPFYALNLGKRAKNTLLGEFDRAIPLFFWAAHGAGYANETNINK